jgi:ribosomal-protein-alanine N-acetyltransferase
MTTVRPLTPQDAPALAAQLQRNREFLAPWDPVRPDSYFTEAGQRAEVESALQAQAAGTRVPFAILQDDELVGRITVNNVVRGPFLSASLGYWVSRDRNGRGVATAAVAAVARIAADELGLHRLEAGTLLHNHGSQHVLRTNGFVQYGVAPRYLRIAGQWQDHALFQLLLEG